MNLKKIKRKARALLLSALILSLLVNAAAADEIQDTVTVETRAGQYEQITVNVTTQTTDNGNGIVTVETASGTENQLTASGMTVSYESFSSLTGDRQGILSGKTDAEYTSENALDGYSAMGGVNARFSERVPLTSAKVPQQSSGNTLNSETGYSAPAGTTSTQGDTKTSSADGEYDYSMDTVIRQGSLTLTTVSDTRTDTVSSDVYDREYLHSDAYPTADNDLFYDTVCYAQPPANEEDYPPVGDGYKYVYIGTGNSSQYWAAHWYTSKNPDYPEEQPFYTDGNNVSYYLRQSHKVNARYNIEGFYLDGVMVQPETVANPAVYSSIYHFNMFDPSTGNVASTYCADLTTNSLEGYSYNVENLEDAMHYSVEQAAMIRSVASCGYWGIADDPATPEPEYGSLNAMKKMMREAVDPATGERIFTDAEIAYLNDGVAMTATQYAIWHFSNAMSDVVFVNAHYIPKDEAFENSQNLKTLGNIPEEKRGCVNLIMKLYHYLIHLEPTEYKTPNTSNTIINADNFTRNLTVTLTDKPESYSANQDSDRDNDVYLASLSFTLPYEPQGGDSDSLVVKIYEGEKLLAAGRISGNDGDEPLIEPDQMGVYTFKDIPLTEGGWNITVAMTGWQQLDRGVCLFTSEVREDTTSQTMVGVSSGKRAVDVKMELSLDTDVKDEVFSVQKVWRMELPYSPPPVTGDSVLLPLFIGFTALCAAFAGVVITKRRRI